MSLALVGAVSSGLVYYFLFRTDAQIQRLQTAAAIQVGEGDFEAAATAFERIVELKPDSEAPVYLSYIDSLQRLGDHERLNELLQKLAPDSEPGLAAAHQIRAVQLANNLRPNQVANLAALRWHLSQSGDENSIGLNLAWARYLVAMGDGKSAVDRFRRAARVDPCYWLNVVMVLETLGDRKQLAFALEDGESALTEHLAATPSDERLRGALAELYFKSNRFEDCDAVLRQGAENFPSEKIDQMRASFLVARYLATQASLSIDEKLQLVGNAFELDSGNEKVQQAVELLYVNVKETEHKQAVLRMLVSHSQHESPSQQTGHAEFVLGQLYGIEGNFQDAYQYAEAAWLRNPNDHRRSHLLAWLLLKLSDGSDSAALSRSNELAQNAVSQNPGDFDYRLTQAMIQFAQRQFNASTITLQAGLMASRSDPSKRQKIRAHKLLSTCYREMGKIEFADAHADSIQRLQSAIAE